jgi:hypothetical protein
MKTFGFVLTMVLVCLAGTVQADTVNLLTNGDFSDGITNWWSAYSGTFATDTSSPDAHNAIITGEVEAGQDMRSISLIAGQQYNVSYMAASPDGSAVNGAWGSPLWTRLFWNAPSGSPYGELYGSYGGGTVEQLNAGWATYSATFIMPAGHDGTWLQLCFDTQGWGKIAIDNVSVRPVPEPGTVVLLITGIIGLAVYAWQKRK